MPITEEERKRNALQKEVIKSSTSNIEEDVAFGGNKHLFRVEGEMDKGRGETEKLSAHNTTTSFRTEELAFLRDGEEDLYYVG